MGMEIEQEYVVAADRGVVEIAGTDTRAFLQGLVSNDVHRAAPDRAIYAALLTPQGRYLHDFFIVAPDGERLLLDCEGERRHDLTRRLSLYKLRSKVTIADATPALAVVLLFGPGAIAALDLPREPGRARPFAGGIVYVDPRLPELGARAVLPRAEAAAACRNAGFAETTAGDYGRLRLSLGVPGGSRDLAVEKAIPLEVGLDELNAIDWDKGCYMGQELTARTRYRGLVRKRLVPVTIEGPTPQPGAPVLLGEEEAGILQSAEGGLGLALLRIELLERAMTEGAPFTAGEARLVARKPAWARF